MAKRKEKKNEGTESIDKLKQEIFERISKIYNIREHQKEFVPGKTRIHFAGRVFDEKEIIKAADSTIDFWLTLGENDHELRKQFSSFLKVKHSIFVNSGSSANLLAVACLFSDEFDNKLAPGDETITPAATFPTTLNAIIQYKMKPVLVDVDLPTYNVSPETIRKAITSKTKLLVLPHAMGNPMEMDEIMKIAKNNDLLVIEDACDALDSKYKGKLCGTFGDIGTFSFYPAHHMTMGEGGAVVTNSMQIARIVKSLRDWGRACYCDTNEKNSNGACNNRFNFKINGIPYDHKYIYSNIGYNLKPLDIQCAIAIEQLKKLPGFTKARKKNFNKVYNALKPYEKKIFLPEAVDGAEPSWFSFLITIKDDVGFTREKMVKYLEGNNIETRHLFAGNVLDQPAYKNINFRISGDLKNSKKLVRDTFFIGVYPGMTDEMSGYVVEKLVHFLKNN